MEERKVTSTDTPIELDKYGMARLRYLRNHCPAEYAELVSSGKLNQHLYDVQEQANNRFDLLITHMKKAEGVTEELKAKNQMRWVGLMNNLRDCADEIIFNELIYV